MPIYEYLCEDCGPFTEMRAMARSAEPAACPGCDCKADRAFLTAPRVLGMDAGLRLAMSINERNRHQPGLSGAMDPKARGKHPSGCGCCGGLSKPKKTAIGANGAKTFPSSRPWMISH